MNEHMAGTIDGGFLQSEHWASFQRALGRTVVRVSEREVGTAGMIKHTLPLVGGYFFVPRGPVFQFSILNSQFSNKTEGLINDRKVTLRPTKQGVQRLLDAMIDAAKNEGVGWIRVEPQTFEELAMIQDALHGRHALVKSKKNHEPAQTLMLDLTRSEDDLLAMMKPKTRYNIRLSAKKGVTVTETRSEADIDLFCDLVEETAKRDQVVAHPRSYYQTMLSSINPSVLKLYVARYQQQVIAGSIVSVYGTVATYQHGASSNEHRNVMAPYLLQWHAIDQAKQRGMQRYDFGGTRIKISNSHLPASKNSYNGHGNDLTASVAKSNHVQVGDSWQGITRFKVGFCPHCHPVQFPGCYDIVLSRGTYQTYRTVQWVKGTMHR